MSSSPRRALEIASWGLYDFANTIFSLNVLSYHFPLWLTVDRGLGEWRYALVLSAASVVSAAAMPVTGYLSDRLGARRAPLAVLTVGCVAATAFLARSSLWAVIACFALANVFYNAAQIVYNAQITRFPGAHRGWVSGMGVALGYAGTVCGLLVVRPFTRAGGHEAAFVPTAALFLLFSLPCLFICRDEPGTAGTVRGLTWRYDFRRVWRKLGETSAVRRFALFSFVLLNVTTVLILFMTVFAKKAAGLSDAETERMILVSAAAAAAGALAAGRAYDRKDPVRVMGWVAALWIAAFAVNAGFRFKPVFFTASAFAGAALGATWSVTRVYLLRLVPETELAEYYGIFGFLGRAAMFTAPAGFALLFKLLEPFPAVQYDVLNGVLFASAAFSAWLWSGTKTRDSARKLEV